MPPRRKRGPGPNRKHGQAAGYYQNDPNAPSQAAAYYQNDPNVNGQQPPPPPPQYGEPYGPHEMWSAHGEKVSFEQTFKLEKPKFNDLWAGILLILVFLGFVAVSGLSIHGYAQTKGFNGGGIYDGDNDFGLSTGTIILFAFCLIVSLVLSLAYVWLAQIFTKQFIWITGILNIILGFALAIYMLYRHYWSGGIVFLLFAVFTLICFITWIPRIPFSVVMLRTSIDVSKSYGHVYLVSALGGLAAAAFAAWYSVTLVAIYVKYQPGRNPACDEGGGGCSSGKVIGLVAFITFAAYWISEWLKNTIHSTISGVYGSWYFCQGNLPTNATRGAFKRSMTYSFGSISLGSLIVAIINFLRQACSIAQHQEGAQGNFIGYAIFCVLRCFISILEWIVEFINRYAFSYIALYGTAYFPAAKKTWKLIRDRGIDALVNHCLIGSVLSIGALFIGFTCAILAYVYLMFTSPGYNSNGDFTPVIVAFAFLIGLQICHVFTTPLSSGIDTIFVASAWDPEVLMRDHPDLYARMVSVYPHVQQAIHA